MMMILCGGWFRVGFLAGVKCEDWLWGPPNFLFIGLPSIKQSGREADHSFPSYAKVRNEISYSFTPQYAFRVCTRRAFTSHCCLSL
jgi:hypothetical protein